MRRPWSYQIFGLIFLFCLLSTRGFAQTSQLEGVITTDKGNPLPWVNIRIKSSNQGTVTDSVGFYRLTVPSNKRFLLSISYVGYKSIDTALIIPTNKKVIQNFRLISETTQLPSLEVREQNLKLENITSLNPQNVLVTPAASSGVEGLIKTLPGVTSNNELSSEYSVRGGNYDENLVYVNGIEIYRPFLVNTGQQEGLSFINPDLVSKIDFSAGGFGVQYGDKMSSVLNITYKHPESTGGSVYLSLLGAGVSVQGTNKNHRFTYLIGSRYKTNRYLLGTLDTKGDYKPDFIDLQALLTYQLSKKWDVSLLGYYSSNKYQIVPSSRETDFGTAQQPLRFSVYFDGQEVDQYNLAQGGLTFNYHPNKSTTLNFIVSGYNTKESETYDILGQYWIGEINNEQTTMDEGQSVQTLGIGSFLRHARDYFTAKVFTLQHNGSYFYNGHHLIWGVRYQHQFVDDQVREWQVNDSTGYFLPNPIDIPGNLNPNRPDLNLYYFISAHNILSINRFSAYASNRWNFTLRNKSLLGLTAGARFYYWDFTHEFLFSPRFNLAYFPTGNPSWTFRFASGIYYQPPFYREMREMDGQINHNIKSPRAIHFILSGDHKLNIWDRPFLFTAEAYYKRMDRFIPYEVNNLQIRYFASEVAKAYATGIDFRLSGAFVKGIDSWISLSFLKAAEDVQGDYYYNYYAQDGTQIPASNHFQAVDSAKVSPGYIPLPMDSRMNVKIFFQDYIPGHKAFKVHLRLLFGTGLPFGPPQSQPYQQTLRMPDYRRVDVGFSWNLLHHEDENIALKKLKSLWVTLEVFNLFQVYNTVSYNWITDVENQNFAVPNYLTTRRVNLKVMINF
ncbi:MAG: TonB-dependent receptor [Bacteroidales bacterium]|nr:TonB-dependent receptor [Bacteroidales bacterium]